MGESADVVFFRAQHFKNVEDELKGFSKPYIIRQINDRWAGLYFKDNAYSAETKLLELSHHTPMMYYTLFDDAGWGYSIYTGGKKVTEAGINYDMFGDEDAQHTIPENFEAFRAFGLDDAVIRQIEQSIMAQVSVLPSEASEVEYGGFDTFLMLLGIPIEWGTEYGVILHEKR